MSSLLLAHNMKKRKLKRKGYLFVSAVIDDDLKENFECTIENSNFRRNIPSNHRCRPHRNLDKIWGKSDKR